MSKVLCPHGLLPPGFAVVDATEKWTYDSLNRLKKTEIVKPQSATTYDAVNYEYDRLSRLKRVHDGSNIREELTTYRNDGDVHQTTDALGRVVEYAYDKWGRVVDETRYSGTGVNDVTRTVYDGFARVSSITENFGSGDPITTTFGYDNVDRYTTTTNALGGVKTNRWNVKGQIDRITNEYNQFIDITRDNVGRVLQTRYTNWADLEKQTFTYDAYDRVKTSTDALGNTTTNVFDNAGRMTQSVGPIVGGTSATTSYAYDTPGNLISLTDAAGNATTFEYDKRGRMRFDRITVGGTVLSREYQYYLNDTLQWYKDRDFNWREYKFNFVLGDYQTSQERWWKSGQGVNGYIYDINYQYTDPKGLLLTDIFEQVPSSTTPNPNPIVNHIEYDYDALARVDKVRTYLTGNGATAGQSATSTFTTFVVDHDWDAIDRRDKSAFTFSDQTSSAKKEFRNDYTFDKLDRLTSVVQDVSSSDTSWVVDAARKKDVTLEYYANSQLKKLTRKQGTNTSGLITDYTQNGPDFDNQVPGRISNVIHSGISGGSKTTSYDFDLAGRIIQKNTSGPQSYNYQYDGTDQLALVTTAPAGGGTVLQDPNFNAVGNDTGHTVSQHNRVTNDGTYSYEYNNEGSRTKRTKNIGGSYEVYAYDHRQRLTSVKSYTLGNVETSDVRYEYDALDRRFRRKVDTNNNDTVFEVNQRLLYDTNPVNPEFDEVIQIIDDSTGNRQHRFFNGPQPDMVLTDEVFNGTGTPTDILWLLQDHQNSVTDVATIPTSGTATLRNHLEYNAFGQITSQTNAAYAPVQTYTGQILDTTTGLLYYDARWYDPQLGRFINEDPIGFAAGDANLSRYVGNSWPNGVDPTGLDEADQNSAPPSQRVRKTARQQMMREMLRRIEENQNLTQLQKAKMLIVLYQAAYTQPIARTQAEIDAYTSESAIKHFWYIISLQSLDHAEQFGRDEAAYRAYKLAVESGESELLGTRMPEWALPPDLCRTTMFYRKSREQLAKDLDALLTTLDLVTFVGTVVATERAALSAARAEARLARAAAGGADDAPRLLRAFGPQSAGAAQTPFETLVESNVADAMRNRIPTADAWEIMDLSKPHKVANLDPNLGPNQVRYQAEFFDHVDQTHIDISINYDPDTCEFGIIKEASGK